MKTKSNIKEEFLVIALFISCFILQAESAGMWERISTGITEFVRGSKNRREATAPYNNLGANYYNNYNRYGYNRNDMMEFQGDRYGLENGNQYSPAMSALSLLGFLFFLNLISQTMTNPMMGGAAAGRRKRHVNISKLSPEELNACVQRFICEINQHNDHKYVDFKQILTNIASIGFSYAIHGKNESQLESDFKAVEWGNNGKNCNLIAAKCPDFPT